MTTDPMADLAQLLDEGRALRHQARAAHAGAVATATGSDHARSVTVRLDAAGRVTEITIADGWRRRLEPRALGTAVVEAVRAAATARLNAWGAAYANQERTADGRTPGGAEPDGEHLAEQLQRLATAPMTGADGRAALEELLAMAEAVERGIDAVSAQLDTTISATHTGRNRDSRVAVTVSGAGEVTEVRYDTQWLRTAQDGAIERQTMVAFQTAYDLVAQHGVRRLIADSELGEVQRATQDPFGLARRLRLSE